MNEITTAYSKIYYRSANKTSVCVTEPLVRNDAETLVRQLKESNVWYKVIPVMDRALKCEYLYSIYVYQEGKLPYTHKPVIEMVPEMTAMAKFTETICNLIKEHDIDLSDYRNHIKITEDSWECNNERLIKMCKVYIRKFRVDYYEYPASKAAEQEIAVLADMMTEENDPVKRAEIASEIKKLLTIH